MMSYFFKFNKNNLPSASGLFLLIGDDSVVFLHINDGSVAFRSFLSNINDSSSHESFEYIAKISTCPLYIILTHSDQKYILKNIPNLGLLSFDFFIKMRLNKDFQSFDIKDFCWIESQSNKMDKNKYIFILARFTPYINEWIEKVMNFSTNMKGILLFPLEMQRIFSSLILKNETRTQKTWDIFVVCNKVSGFTHIVFQNNKMIFSKLIPIINNVNPTVLIGSVYQDIQNTIQSLSKLNLSKDDNITLWAILPKEFKPIFLKITDEKFKSVALDANEFLSKIGINNCCTEDRYTDTALCFAILSRIKHIKIFKTEKLRKFYLLCCCNLCVVPISIISFLFLLTISALMFFSSLFENNKIEKYEQELSFLKNQIYALSNNYNTERLNSANELFSMYKTLKAIDYKPLKYIKTLNKMNSYGFIIDQFNWRVSKLNNKLQMCFRFKTRTSGTFFTDYKMLSKEIKKTFPFNKVLEHNVPKYLTANDETIYVYFSLR